MTHAAAHDGGQLGAVLDHDNTATGVWADAAYRSAANLALLERRGLRPQFQRKKPRGKKMPTHIARGNATRARVRSRVEHVFAAQKCRLGLIVRTIGMARARVKTAWPISPITSPGWLGSTSKLHPPKGASRRRETQHRQSLAEAQPTHPLCPPQITARTWLFEVSCSTDVVFESRSFRADPETERIDLHGTFCGNWLQ